MSLKVYKIISIFLFGLTLFILSMQFSARPELSFAQEGKFSHIVPFITNSGLMCFFDRNNGKVYLYDENLKKCLFISQLKELGQDMERISADKQRSY